MDPSIFRHLTCLSLIKEKNTMAGVIGPNRYLPGNKITVPSGATCDTPGHEEIDATHRIVGECDSMGSELIDMCEHCYAEYLKELQEPEAGTCDWCKCTTIDIKPIRDPDEGSCGPVYYVCSGCRREQSARLRAELGI